MIKRMSESTLLNSPYMNGERLSADIGNLLVLAPHPDDESLGCGGLIALLKEAGNTVSVVFITSGSASHPNSKSHPPEILAELRETEAINACAQLGIPKSDIHFVRATDSRLQQLDEPSKLAIARKIASILESANISALAMPWQRDPHPDHVVTNAIGQLVLDTIDSKIIKIEYPIWLWKNGKEEDWPDQEESAAYRLDISQVFPKKWQAVKMHRSQLGEVIFDDTYGFVLTKELLEPFKTPTEYFFLTKLQSGDTLKKDYFDQLYTEQKDPWNFKNSAYENNKYKNSIKVLAKERVETALELGCSVGVQSKMLSSLCQNLMAVDISEKAVSEAEVYCRGIENIAFKVADITQNFPEGKFDLTSCSEIGYYLKIEDLIQLFENMHQSLNPGGRILMVHWTPFVPNYPLSGDAVHDRFEKFAAETGVYHELVHERHERYRLQVWRKSIPSADK